MRYLGIDYGTKRIGLALSDEAGGMAFPHSVVPNDVKKFAVIKKICDENKVGGIVCGVPIGLKMQETAMTIAVRDFAEKLEAHVGIEVHLVNELFSSKEAAHFQGAHSKIDASAAALILESYFNSRK